MKELIMAGLLVGSLAQIPVKDITVFKDGNVFVVHEGMATTNEDGTVSMDYLPSPILGTFWPYSADPSVKLTSVSARSRRVTVERTSLTTCDLLEANPGATVTVSEVEGPSYTATVIGVTTRSAEELEATAPPNTGEKLPEKGNIVLLKTVTGVIAVPLDKIRTVTFSGEPKYTSSSQEFRNLMTLGLDWSGRKPPAKANVGLIYVQQGIRWVPAYKVTLDGKGKSEIKLQATLVNDLIDVNDISAHLVVGVPSFAFAGTIDPISLQQTAAVLGAVMTPSSRMAYGLSNAMMSQTAYYSYDASPAPGKPAPEVTGAERNEDLFVFDLNHITMKKGERLVVPVATYDVPYKDVYTLEIPAAPPPGLRGVLNTQQETEINRLMNNPRVNHKARLTNGNKHPFTTAPALIMSKSGVLCQSMMTYTPVNGNVDLSVGTVTDVAVKKNESETARVPNAVQWQGRSYGRVDLAGTLTLTNYRKEPITVEITRYVLGSVANANENGKTEMVNVLEDREYASSVNQGYYYNWPYWWTHFNGVARIKWNVTLQPGKAQDLTYTWSYYTE